MSQAALGYPKCGGTPLLFEYEAHGVVVVGGVVVESSSRRVFRREYQEGYGWEAAALCDSSQLIGRVLAPGFP